MKNCYILNFEGIFIKEDYTFNEVIEKKWDLLTIPPNNILTTDAVNYISKVNVRMYPVVNLFLGPSYHETYIHLDNLYQSYALNYVIGDSKSKMKWFKTDSDGQAGLTSANTKYSMFKQEDVTLVEEIEIQNNTLMLVRTDIPHQVVNYSDRTRICVSVRGLPFLKWNAAVDYFSNYFV